jgi:hypothetical protein
MLTIPVSRSHFHSLLVYTSVYVTALEEYLESLHFTEYSGHEFEKFLTDSLQTLLTKYEDVTTRSINASSFHTPKDNYNEYSGHGFIKVPTRHLDIKTSKFLPRLPNNSIKPVE